MQHYHTDGYFLYVILIVFFCMYVRKTLDLVYRPILSQKATTSVLEVFPLPPKPMLFLKMCMID